MTKKAEIYYFTLIDEMPRTEKLAWFKNTAFKKIEFDRIIPDKANNWLNQSDNDFESLIPVCDKEVKNDKQGFNQAAIFKLFSNGVVSARDEWIYDFAQKNLKEKVLFFIKTYNQLLDKYDDSLNDSIKWSRDLKVKFNKNIQINFDANLVIKSQYRPFIKQYFYAEKILNDILTQNHYDIFGKNLDKQNKLITTMGDSTGKPFFVLAINLLPDLNFVSPASGGTRCFSLYTYDKDGNRHDNITDWALNQFNEQYRTGSALSTASPNLIITKLDIFHYVYAVLHNPAYREKYQVNLKREFPRIPFYSNFEQWAEIGKRLMDLHLNYETVTPYLLQCEAINDLKNPKAKLKADKTNGIIVLDDNTQLNGIPAVAWEYKLGNRSALEWVLDQHKEKKPKDKTIAEQFNSYRFADYKQQVIDLLSRVCAVSVETMILIAVLKTLNE